MSIITFDQFKASLLNKSINFYNFLLKKLYWLQAFEWYSICYKSFLFPINAVWIFLFIKESWKKTKKKLYWTVLNIIINNINVSWTANQSIIMISGGSCDTEDWSNYAENVALITGINYILKYIQIESHYFK